MIILNEAKEEKNVWKDFQINPLSAYKNKHNWHLDEIDWIERKKENANFERIFVFRWLLNKQRLVFVFFSFCVSTLEKPCQDPFGCLSSVLKFWNWLNVKRVFSLNYQHPHTPPASRSKQTKGIFFVVVPRLCFSFSSFWFIPFFQVQEVVHKMFIW